MHPWRRRPALRVGNIWQRTENTEMTNTAIWAAAKPDVTGPPQRWLP